MVVPLAQPACFHCSPGQSVHARHQSSCASHAGCPCSPGLRLPLRSVHRLLQLLCPRLKRRGKLHRPLCRHLHCVEVHLRVVQVRCARMVSVRRRRRAWHCPQLAWHQHSALPCSLTACSQTAAACSAIAPLHIISRPGTSSHATPVLRCCRILVVGGAGIVLGLATYGYKIMRVLGVKMTKLTNSRGELQRGYCGPAPRLLLSAAAPHHAHIRHAVHTLTPFPARPPPAAGYCVELAAAVIIIIGSRYGLPLSTTHWCVPLRVGCWSIPCPLAQPHLVFEQHILLRRCKHLCNPVSDCSLPCARSVDAAWSAQ